MIISGVGNGLMGAHTPKNRMGSLHAHTHAKSNGSPLNSVILHQVTDVSQRLKTATSTGFGGGPLYDQCRLC